MTNENIEEFFLYEYGDEEFESTMMKTMNAIITITLLMVLLYLSLMYLNIT